MPFQFIALQLYILKLINLRIHMILFSFSRKRSLPLVILYVYFLATNIWDRGNIK